MSIREEPIERSLADYAEVSIAYRVDTMLDVSLVEKGLGGIVLREQAVEPAYVKDYDQSEHPTHWPQRFNVENWGMVAAYDQGERVGGAIIAFRTDNLYMLDGRSDLAVLWDLRVRPESRGKRIGTSLFQATEQWARDRGCSQVKVETQNVNAPACYFYARMGCTLGGVNRFVYPEHPEETQLLWFTDL